MTETEKQEAYLSHNKYNHNQQINSFHIFEPDYFINSAFTLTDSEQRFSSKFLDQPFSLTPVQPSRNGVEQSKLYIKDKTLLSNDAEDSSSKVKKTATPSIENIVLQYQRKQNQNNPHKGLIPCKIEDIFNNRAQFSSVEIKTFHLTKQINLQLKKPLSIESESFQSMLDQPLEDPNQKKSETSLKYIQPQPAKLFRKTPIIEKSAQLKQLLSRVQQSKVANKELENISQFLKSFSKNRRDICAKTIKQKIDWKTFKILIEKELKSCANL